MKNERRLVLLVLMQACLLVNTYCSRQDDSLHVVVNGASSAAARAQALLSLASLHAAKQPGESLAQVKSAASFAEQSGDQRLLLRAIQQERDLEQRAGAFDEFLRNAIRAMGISEKLGDARIMADDLRCLSQAYDRVGAYDKAVETSKQALFLLKTTGDSSAIGKGLLDLMNALVQAGRFSEVLHQSDEALAYYSRQHDTLGTARVWLRQGEALMAQQRYTDARPLLISAERVFNSNGDHQNRLRVLCDLTRTSCALHLWDLARVRLDTAISISRDLGTLNTNPQLFALCSLIDEGEGHPLEALVCQRRHAALKDSLFNEKMAERMTGLQALYQSDRREHELSALLERDQAAEASLASGKARGKWWLLLLLVLVGVLIAGALLLRNTRRLMRRARLKNQVILKQTDEIKAKNLELERQNLRLAESLVNEEEKDVLLKEIHHRVKNNLQIVNTLLKMQGAYADQRSLDEILSDCQGRVRSMALVHEHIYKCGDLSRVNVKAHVMALSASILKNYGLQDIVQVDMNVNYDRAALDNLIPLSLLLNELITNSAKHAFIAREQGRISIVLRRMGDHQCELMFSDDGVGIEQQRFFQNDSFGLELVRTLATQLNGSIKLLKGEGTTFQLTFELDDRPLRKAS